MERRMDTVLDGFNLAKAVYNHGNVITAEMNVKKKALNGAAVIMFRTSCFSLRSRARRLSPAGMKITLGVRWFLRDRHDHKGRIATLRTRQGKKNGFLVGGQYQIGAFEDLDRRPR